MALLIRIANSKPIDFNVLMTIMGVYVVGTILLMAGSPAQGKKE
jgi:hypothetical protein